ncbi:MAG: cobalt-precorrin-6A reductase [Rhodospirillales bacterium]|jgi:precorrin-6A/cobalt-precorrin-6A reductase|nr:cobalt-precorrin-6A reductase [Rhodospirillales bacterium]MDP6883273.1 cobalt-precorrin-6A reductase [Rhodospirillales bacterium]
MVNLLIIGGTGEAADVARQTATWPGLKVTTSLAGKTRDPMPLEGAVLSGGFGGADGMADYLRQAGIDLVIDATHPFAAVISENVATACAAVGVDHVHLVRPPWVRRDGDAWIDVADLAQAASAVAGRRVFLTIGRSELECFAGMEDAWFLVRVIDAPAQPPPLANHHVIEGRPPFTIDGEKALMSEHEIDVVVSKNSGGGATYAKIAAARALTLPVVMVRRPPPPTGPIVASVEETLAWLEKHQA